VHIPIPFDEANKSDDFSEAKKKMTAPTRHSTNGTAKRVFLAKKRERRYHTKGLKKKV